MRKRIEKHKFEDEEGEEYQGSKFGGFNDYFRRKKIKLQNLDAERRSSALENPRIFRGVVAHVNGYTQPSLNDLHALIVDYGGGFMQYLDGKTTVTHIIASNLTPKKKIEFRKYRIVKPAWVVDSVAAGKLLPWESYRVVDEGVGQQILGFDNGSVISQRNSQRAGYRDQTDTSWYTEQLRSVAERVNNGESSEGLLHMPFPSTQVPKDDLSDEDREDQSTYLNSTEEAQSDSPARLPQSLKQSLENCEYDPDYDSDRLQEASDLSGQIAERGATTATNAGLNLTSVKPLQGTENPLEEQNDDLHQAQQEESTETDILNKPPSRTSIMTAEEHNAELLADPRVFKSTVVNPGFLKQYYEESRLHHLSHWKAELKSQLQALAAEKSSSQKSRQKRPLGSRRYILHVDFDCFFAAVSLKKHPELIEKPVAIAHGGGSGSEIASCNYPARNFGVKNGMWMKNAQQLCPDLKVLPYDFKAYEEASRAFYEAIMDTGGIVQSVSVDEALVDVSIDCIEVRGHDGKGINEGSIWREQAKADEIAQGLRDKIKQETGCAVSVGIGGNILLAKVALRKAKPAGQYHVKPEEVLDFIGALNVQDLPGVAYSIGGKLEEIGVKLVKDVRELSKEKLLTTLGPKTGQKLWDYSRGIDRTEVGEQVIRKSVSAEVNWGVRFVTQEQADEFVQSLCDELHKRLISENVKGRQLTMKIMRRAANVPLDPPKHLGHGKCDVFNKSIILGVATNQKEVIGREAISIMRGWGFPPGELRGIGVQVTKLEPLKASAGTSLESSQKRLQFMVPPKKPDLDQITDDIESPPKPRLGPMHPAAAIASAIPSGYEPRKPLNTMGTQFVLPTQVDPEVLAELPADIRSKLLPNSGFNISGGQPRPMTEQVTLKSRSNSPMVHADAFPNQSQLDQETLEALPSDVRAEILAYYNKSPTKPRNQSVLPQSPRKNRSIKGSSKKITTPTKKRTGLLFRGKQSNKFDSNSTLTQSNFVASRAPGKADDSNLAAENEEVSAEFLSALPEDIRREVLAQQRRDRLKRRGGIDIATKKKPQRQAPDQPPPGQRRLQLPPRLPKPTFTANKLTALPDLREAVSAWFEEFKDEGPYEEDVDALVLYLRRVIVDEKDMAKAVGVVKWLRWVVDQGGGEEVWKGPLKKVEEGVQGAVVERGLGRLAF